MKSFTGLLLFMCLTTLAWGQNDTLTVGKTWTLRQCIDFALEQSLMVERNELSVQRSEVDYQQAKWALAPTLNAQATHGYNWGRSINPVTNLFTTQEIQSNQLAAFSSVLLFGGLRQQNTLKQTSHDLQASNMDLQKAKNDVIIDVVTLYINVIFNQELLETAKFQLNSSQEQLSRVTSQVDAGALARSEQLNLEAQVASDELNVINQENALVFSILQLKQAMQLTADAPLAVEVPDLGVEDLVLEQSREEIYQIALQSMPEIQGAKLRVESSEYGMKAAKGNLYPRLTLNGSVTTNYSSASDRQRFVPDGGDPVVVPEQIGYVQGTGTPVFTDVEVPSGVIEDGYSRSDQFQDNVFRAVGLTLSIPILNGYSNRAQYQRSVISRQEAEINATDVRNQLRQAVETAYNDALAASKTFTSAQKQVDAREEAFRMMKQRFEAGAANYVEFQVSQNDLFRAISDLSRAKYNFIFRKKILDFYQNKPIEF